MAQWYACAVVAVFGALVGSYINMLVYRLPRELDTVRRRSFCPHCQHVLGVVDLVPLLSYLWFRGRCHYCQQAIGLRYFLVEFFLALSASWLWYEYSGRKNFMILGFVLLAVGVALILIDFEFQILPDSLTLGFLAFTLFMIFMRGYTVSSTLERTAVGLTSGAFMFALAWTASKILKQEAMGGGDIKWAAAMGAVLGFPRIVVGLFLGFLMGSLIAIFALAVLKKGRRDAIPFGPALVLGTWVAYFWGQNLWDWYWRF